MDHATKDFVYVGEGMLDAGADGMDFDTTGGAGDGDFLSTLRAVKHLRDKYPEAGIEVGMAGEFVIGVHGELEWDGRRLAGLWPKGQLEVCQDAGVTLFGPAVNINTGKSCAWNTAYSLTAHQALHGRGTHPRAPQRGTGRLRRAGQRLSRRRRLVARGQGARRGAALRRVVGGFG